MKRFLKILKWSAISVVGLFVLMLGLGAIISNSHTLTAADHAAGQTAVDHIQKVADDLKKNTPVAAKTENQQPQSPAAKPAENTQTPAKTQTPAPTPDPQPSQPSQAEIDAANAATAQFKLDMLTSDIGSDIRAEDKNQVFLDNVLQQGKFQQAYQSAQGMSDKIDNGQQMYQTIADELENSPIKAKLKDIAINAKINLQGYQNGYKDYMMYLDSGKQFDLYNAQKNFAVAKASMQDLETQLTQMGGHDQNQ